MILRLRLQICPLFSLFLLDSLLAAIPLLSRIVTLSFQASDGRHHILQLALQVELLVAEIQLVLDLVCFLFEGV